MQVPEIGFPRHRAVDEHSNTSIPDSVAFNAGTIPCHGDRMTVPDAGYEMPRKALDDVCPEIYRRGLARDPGEGLRGCGRSAVPDDDRIVTLKRWHRVHPGNLNGMTG